jgi:NAD(P)-dependent dehydrogenase (short-subunit alcohol dehydrogenase family)
MLLDYSMTKGAQVAMVRVLSNQLLSKGIRVNAVCPGRESLHPLLRRHRLTI